MLSPFIIDLFPYHVWVGEYKRSVVGDTAEKIHTIVKMVLHESYNSSTFQNDIGIANGFSEHKHFFYLLKLETYLGRNKYNLQTLLLIILPFHSCIKQSVLIHQRTLRAVFISSDHFTF